MASFQAKTGWGRGRECLKKEILILIHSNLTRNMEFQKNSKKIKKIKKYHCGFFSSQNGMGQAKNDGKKKKNVPISSQPIRNIEF